jgi:glycosyltransferase involved in cell wall biosynthesis
VGNNWAEIPGGDKRYQMKGKLVIISHTEHYLDLKGTLVGWGPTVREINALSTHFKQISHIAVLHNTNAPNTSLGYSSKNINFIPLKPTGGNTLWAKLRILLYIFRLLQVVRKELKDAEFVQLRLPTGIGVFLLPYFAITKSKRTFTFWVKYAGNWNESNPPLGYAFQRWFLKKDFCHCKVTINGYWPDQPNHCFSFENPCLTEEQLKLGSQMIYKRKFEPPFNFIFIGRLEDAKGVGLIIDVFRNLDENFINSVKFIGDGPKRSEYEKMSKELENIIFLGGLNNELVHKELKQADFLLLPSVASEGFPKVIAEAACFGVLPIVSDVGSITHYINKNNGFICNSEHIIESFKFQLINALIVETSCLKQKSIQAAEIAKLFTFNAYLEKLKHNIFAS